MALYCGVAVRLQVATGGWCGAVAVDRMDERPPQNVAHLFFGDAVV